MSRRGYSVLLQFFLFVVAANGFTVSPLFSGRRHHHQQAPAQQPLTHLPTAATFRSAVDAPSVEAAHLLTTDAKRRANDGREVAAVAVATIGLDDVAAFSHALLRAILEDIGDLTYTLTSALLSLQHPVAAVLGLLPPWVRFFAQPFLAAYFVPLFLLRTMAQPRPKVQWSGAQQA